MLRGIHSHCKNRSHPQEHVHKQKQKLQASVPDAAAQPVAIFNSSEVPEPVQDQKVRRSLCKIVRFYQLTDNEMEGTSTIPFFALLNGGVYRWQNQQLATCGDRIL
jgi:hypothetical protein